MSDSGTPRTVEEIDGEITSTVGRVRELKRLRYEKTSGADYSKLKRDAIRLGFVNRKKNKKRDIAGEIQRTDAGEIAQIREKLDAVKGIDKELNALRKKLDNLEAKKTRLAGKAPSLSQKQRRRAVVKEKRLHSNVKKIAKLVNRIDQQERNDEWGGAGPSSSSAQYFGGGGQPQAQPKSTAELKEKLGRIEAMVGGRLGDGVQPRHLPSGLAPLQGSYDSHYQLPYQSAPSKRDYAIQHQPFPSPPEVNYGNRFQAPLPSAPQRYESNCYQSLFPPTSQDNYGTLYQPTHSQVLQGNYGNCYQPPQPPSGSYGSRDRAPSLRSPQGNYNNRYQPTPSQPPSGSYGSHDQPLPYGRFF